MQSMIRTTAAAQELASELFQRFRAHSQEAEQVALELIQCGHARLKLEMILAGEEPTMRLLLEPTEDEGDAVEIAASRPESPSPEGVSRRMWFFGRLSHWNGRH
ncbi:MAG TPA: hypothetical protein GX403_16445 [Rhodocyclaceae bacterium]|nr:hypothetical protein [Rhodocyclaceae bacterium]